jgi:NAD(P)-dependent dehydrogenase (short-subunit alcohol dehydrogenase family)
VGKWSQASGNGLRAIPLTVRLKLAMRLEHKVALITGASSGIGRASVLMFAQEGAQVVALDRDAAGLAETQAQVEAAGGQCRSLLLDVSQEAQVEAAIAQVATTLGRIDILFNNAGISVLKPITETTEADWDQVMGVNLKGVFFGCKHAIPWMVSQGKGVIINTASELAIVAQPLYSAYCASKGGVLAMTRALSLEWATKGIRVNSICPGPIETPMLQAEFNAEVDPVAGQQSVVNSIPLGRLGKPEDVAKVAVFLASDDAEFIHGASITVDGGKTAM